MNKSRLLSFALLLGLANVSNGQGPETRSPVGSEPEVPFVQFPLAPTHVPSPGTLTTMPIANSVVATSLGDAPLPPSCFHEEGCTHGVYTAGAKYVLWFIANPRDTTPIASVGVGGAVLGSVGDADHTDREPASGGRLSFGYWEIRDNPWMIGGIPEWGIQANFFFIGSQGTNFNDNSTTIARGGIPIALPGLATGAITASAQAEIWGAEANYSTNVYYDYPGTICAVNLLAGFRYVSLDQRFDVGSTTVFNNNLAAFPAFVPLAGNTLQVFDGFAAHNRFYGGQVGIAGRWSPGEKVYFDAAFKLALGATSEDLSITGVQLRTPPGGQPIASQGGLLVPASILGDHSTTKFAQVPELEIKASSRLTNWLTLSAGFSTLYWSRILRPAQQIEPSLDAGQLANFPPGAVAAAAGRVPVGPSLRQSDLWLMGVSLGLEIS